MWLNTAGLAIFLTFQAVHGSENEPARNESRRIINGREVDITEFPFQVSIEALGIHSCGGALIHPELVLTAAHCVQILGSSYQIPWKLLSVRAGATVAGEDGQVYPVKSLIYHQNFHRDPVSADLAVILMSRPVQLSKKVLPILLFQRPPQPGEMAIVTGYGDTIRQRNIKKAHLRMIMVPIVPFQKCKEVLRPEGGMLSAGMICAGLFYGRDACQGDSGGPLTINGRLAGITSWGIGCGREGLPGVYSNVYNYLRWISKTANTLLSLKYHGS